MRFSILSGFVLSILFLLHPPLASANGLVSRVYLFEEGIFSFNHAQTIPVRLTSDATSLLVGDYFLPQDDTPLRVQLSRPTAITDFEQIGLGRTPDAVLIGRVRLWEQTTPNRVASLIGTPTLGAFSPLAPQTHSVNGYPAAVAIQHYHWGDNQSMSIFIAVVDVGQNHLVTLVASSAVGDSNTVIAQYEADLMRLLDSLRFTPNVDSVTVQALPLSYMGEIGRLHTGLLSFTYPKNWYILPVGGNVLITNTNQLAINELVIGQVQTQIIPPDFNLTAFADRDQIVNCTIPEETLASITPMAVLQMQMLSEARLTEYERNGVTYIAPQTTHIGERLAAYMTLFTPDRDAFVIAIDLGDGNIASLMAFSAPNDMSNYTSDLFSIAASLRYETNACSALDADGGL